LPENSRKSLAKPVLRRTSASKALAFRRL
jgi:hypothetical protein